MATIKASYGTSTAITITAATLATGSSRESASVDNGTNLYDDVLITVNATLAAGAPAQGSGIYIYAAFSEDGTNFSTNATGTDAAITLDAPPGVVPIGSIATITRSTATWRKVMPLAMFNGGTMPRKWSIVVNNASGFAFTAFTATYSGVTYTSN